MLNNKSISFYDFDETLTNFQTPDKFVNFCLKSKNKNIKIFIFKILKSKFVNKLTSRLKFLKAPRKKILLKLIKGYSYNEIKEFSKQYYEENIKNNLNKELIETLNNEKKQNKRIIVVSAGYEVYIEHFKKDFQIEAIISNKFKFVKNVFPGELLNNDCIGFEKVKRIKKYLKIKDNKLKNSISYSDCFSDQPLFDFTEKFCLIKDGKIIK